jgi:hypothetical protein
VKAVISSDFTDIYLFNIPIVAWAWKQLGVDVIWFQHSPKYGPFKSMQDETNALRKLDLISYTRVMQRIEIQRHFFDCPIDKAATYAQVSRLFGCCLNLPDDEILITSDADMLLMHLPKITTYRSLCVFGDDLVPTSQLPMCYASASVKGWRDLLNFNNESYQEMLDRHLAHENCENMRGNLWCRDQELLYSYAMNSENGIKLISRARPGTQFAENRLDRDDAYILDRLSPDIVDYHMHRPLWEPANFEKLMTIMKYFWPDENFTWIVDYCEAYKKLL